MTDLRKKLAISCAKLTKKLLRLLGKNRGFTLPGLLARLIDPNILTDLAVNIHSKIIVVMGTNGKTTVNHLLNHLLTTQGKKVVANLSGSNMVNGIITALLLATDNNGYLDTDFVCMEVDELAASYILPQLQPTCVLLLNLSRDQLDRYGEIDILCDKIQKALLTTPQTTLILNCDDVFLSSLSAGCKNPLVTYGINETFCASNATPLVTDSIFCRFCGEKLIYHHFHYSHLGDYFCPRCSWRRPQPMHTANHISIGKKRSSFAIDNITFSFNKITAYNIYNTLSACAVMEFLGFSPSDCKAALQTFDYSNDREGCYFIKGACVQLCLAKNPVGFQQKISQICMDPNPKDLLIQINDKAQDGTDISWLWDVNFSYLENAAVASFIATGSRRHDMALRLKYENIPCITRRNIRSAFKHLCAKTTGNIYIIVNYSGLFHTNALLKKLQDSEKTL